MERRIFGLENEYGVTCTLRGQRRLSPDEVARYLFRRVVSWGRSSNVFLENGARLYLDVGSHPEYATPECDSIYDLVVHDKAGERILESLLLQAEHIWEGVSSATTRSRPIINTRDEPHADAERFRRLHVIVGDSNMSEYATFLKVGATSILLRMLEDPNVVLRDMTLENPIRAIREISHDITCKRKVRLANGRAASALDIQAEYLSRAQRYHETKGLSPLEEKALDMWEHCLTAIEKDPMTLDRECDWVIKHKLVDAYRQRHGVALTHPKIALMDLQYHDISRERSLFYRMQQRGLVDRVCTDDAIDTAMDEPPQTTRA